MTLLTWNLDKSYLTWEIIMQEYRITLMQLLYASLKMEYILPIKEKK